MQERGSFDLARTTFQLLALGILIASSFWLMRPFLIQSTWAITIVVATWPLLLRVQALCGNRRAPAVAVMTIALLLILVVPLYFGVDAIVSNAGVIDRLPSSLATLSVPQPPSWVASLPLFGTRIAGRWQHFAAMSPEEIANLVAPYARDLALALVRQVGSVGLLLVYFLVTVIIAAILYANGETAARGADRFARRLAGARGANAVLLSSQAIRGVALGVVVTAIIQTTLAGLGLVVAGVPFATVLTAVIFMLCIAQLGPVLVLLPAVFWVYSRSGPTWGTVFLVWALFCALLDNVVRPVLIKRGADLPLLLIFAGVIGGLIAFGVIGLFLGPTVLAVAYTLLVDWVAEGDSTDDQPSSGATAEG
jgi:predicted PurR-regulated permease PerM